MKRKLIVDVQQEQMDVAVIESDKLVEYHHLKREHQSMVSNIYIGKVKNMVKGMDAAFLDIGLEKNGYLKLNEGEKLKCGEEVLVQVIKPPFKEKGAVLTRNISIPGKYAVIKPFDAKVYVSKKIEDQQKRKSLKYLVKTTNESGYGFIIRTDALEVTEDELLEDITMLIHQWEDIAKYYRYKQPFTVVYEEPSPLVKLAKDLLIKDNSKMVINDEEEYQVVKRYFEEHYETLADQIECYEDKEWHIFNLYKVQEQLKKALRPKVWLRSGACLVIEPTEALVSIDVNSAKFTGKKGLSDTILKVNLEACNEIARQLRLRALSGIIIIDFIDMKDKEHEEAVKDALKEALKKDKVKSVVLDFTQLGLLEMTRKKTSEPLYLQLGKG